MTADHAATATRFRDTLADPAGFATLVELVPWAGPLSDAKAEKHLAMGRALAADPRITGMTVTDNAGGHIKLSPLSLGRALVDMGATVVAHMSCRDRSRGALTTLAWDLASAGMTDILALSRGLPGGRLRGHVAGGLRHRLGGARWTCSGGWARTGSTTSRAAPSTPTSCSRASSCRSC